MFTSNMLKGRYKYTLTHQVECCSKKIWEDLNPIIFLELQIQRESATCPLFCFSDFSWAPTLCFLKCNLGDCINFLNTWIVFLTPQIKVIYFRGNSGKIRWNTCRRLLFSIMIWPYYYPSKMLYTFEEMRVLLGL